MPRRGFDRNILSFVCLVCSLTRTLGHTTIHKTFLPRRLREFHIHPSPILVGGARALRANEESAASPFAAILLSCGEHSICRTFAHRTFCCAA